MGGSDRRHRSAPGRIAVDRGAEEIPTITTLRTMNTGVGQALAWRTPHTAQIRARRRPLGRAGLGGAVPWHRQLRARSAVGESYLLSDLTGLLTGAIWE